MAQQTLTLNIPDDLYNRLKERAGFYHRTIEAELLDLVTTAIVEDAVPPDILEAVAGLSQLDQEALRQTVRSSRLSPEMSEEIEELHFKRQREGLTATEQERLAWLMHQYDKAMFVRTHAIGLLKDQGPELKALLEEL